MLIHNVIVDRHKMQMDVELKDISQFRHVYSEEYTIGGVTTFRMWVIIKKYSPKSVGNTLVNSQTTSNQINDLHVWVFVKFTNNTNNSAIYTQFFSRALNINHKRISVDNKYHFVTDKRLSIFKFDVSFTVELMSSNNVDKLQHIYYNTELTDFELRGLDGSVKVHKYMLAAASPVFQTMLQGDWKETKNGYIDFKEFSKVTLQEFKQYIYMNKLPLKVSKEILIIAMRYEIQDMETICIYNLVQTMESKDLRNLLEFAITNKNDRLRQMILKHLQDGNIKVNRI